jgi:hypothetical protein
VRAQWRARLPVARVAIGGPAAPQVLREGARRDQVQRGVGMCSHTGDFRQRRPTGRPFRMIWSENLVCGLGVERARCLGRAAKTLGRPGCTGAVSAGPGLAPGVPPAKGLHGADERVNREVRAVHPLGRPVLPCAGASTPDAGAPQAAGPPPAAPAHRGASEAHRRRRSGSRRCLFFRSCTASPS